jgi:hypothetical protein
MCTALDVVTF